MEKAFRSLGDFRVCIEVLGYASRSSVEGNNKAQFKHDPGVTFRWLLNTKCLCASPPPRFICCSPNPQCDAIGRGGLWQVIRFR